MYFILTYNQNVVVVNCPEDVNEQKNFLGYEFVNTRGKEQFKVKKENGKINNKLYDEDNLYNESKINSYILNIFDGKNINSIDEELENLLSIKAFHKMINFNSVDFDNIIYTSSITKEDYSFKGVYENKALNNISELQYIQGVTYDKNQEAQVKTQKRILTADNIIKNSSLIDLKNEKYIYDNVNVDDDKKLKKNDIFMCTSSGSLKHLGKSAFIVEDSDYYFGGFCAVLRSNDYYLSKYIYYILNTSEFRNYILTKKGQNINNLNRGILQFEIPMPKYDEIKYIVEDRDSYENRQEEKRKSIDIYREEIQNKINSILISDVPKLSIKSKFNINPFKKELDGVSEDTKVSFIDMDSVTCDGKISKKVIKDLQDVKRDYTYFREDDILFAKITPCMENGKGAIATNLENGIGFGSSEFFVLRNKGEYNNKLLYYILQSNKFRLEAKDKMKGKVGQKRVPKEFIEDYLIPDLDSSIQDAHVKELDTINQNIDKLYDEINKIEIEKNSKFINHINNGVQCVTYDEV